ncbi:uncharacterized protein METZ01_LOCUS496553, partial [marine metagenome]
SRIADSLDTDNGSRTSMALALLRKKSIYLVSSNRLGFMTTMGPVRIAVGC